MEVRVTRDLLLAALICLVPLAAMLISGRALSFTGRPAFPDRWENPRLFRAELLFLVLISLGSLAAAIARSSG